MLVSVVTPAAALATATNVGLDRTMRRRHVLPKFTVSHCRDMQRWGVQQPSSCGRYAMRRWITLPHR